MPVISFLRRLAREDRGFTTVTVMMVVLVGGLLVTGAFAAANPDILYSRADQDRKAAYAAAEAGLNVYAFHLNQDNGYWARCTNVPPPNATESSAVNQPWNGAGADPRAWRTVQGTNTSYAIELLPANGYTQCSEAQAEATMIDNTNGTFRIRATGKSNQRKRSIVATFKRRSFLDYIYFTNFETADPVTYGTASAIAWASANCQVWYRQNRDSQCTAIQFAANDVVAGPFHTNDDILTCTSPTFGRTPADPIEVSAPAPGYRPSCGPATPNFLGTWTTSAPVLTMPPSNTTLKTLAGVTYTGTTKIALNGANMTITPPTGAPSTVAIPSNGVIYVQSGTCGSTGYNINQDYSTPTGCGDVWVHGTTSQNITIAADNDVIVDGDLYKSADNLVGLIANNFVRVYHPVTRPPPPPPGGGGGGEGGGGGGGTSCTGNATGTMQNITIQAAILALQHSFIVDNYFCGAQLGTLTVLGAIAQRFRGPVGTMGSSGGTGYTKSYNYDDRLRYREPPSFLDPVQVSWRIARQNEQIPPR
jgi:Tfp pilus assembly protein PilX